MSRNISGLNERPNPAKGISSETVLCLYNDGMSTTQVAQKLGVSKGTVRYHLIKLGFPIRNISEAVKLKIQRGEFHIGGSGSLNPAWKGGKFKNSQGYILMYAPNHSRKQAGCYVPEHILVWETVHKQPLPKGWIIHHLNGIRDDNRSENLVASPTKNHRDFIKALQSRISDLEREMVDKPKSARKPSTGSEPRDVSKP